MDANEDLIFLFGGVESQHWGEGPLHPARLGEEVPADSWGGAWTAPHERTQLPAQTLLALGLPQFVLNPS